MGEFVDGLDTWLVMWNDPADFVLTESGRL